MEPKFHFSKNSLRQLRTCHLGLRKLAARAIRYQDFSIVNGRRSEAEQNRLYVIKATKLPWPHSKHNVVASKWEAGERSMAFDFRPWPMGHWPCTQKDPESYVKDVARWYMHIQTFKNCAQDLGMTIRCGGDWDMDGDILDQKFDDLGHIELIL